MQLKEEFRTYEALRREHDAQIVHIAMEAGLRISPEQWSSLLYGDLVHKSHMQSIIDKVSAGSSSRAQVSHLCPECVSFDRLCLCPQLQSPESFAKSVQELTIVLQRTGDPANLTSLRPHLELLANIDHNPGAAVWVSVAATDERCRPKPSPPFLMVPCCWSLCRCSRPVLG